MEKKTYGKTRRGRPITDELIEELAQKAEEGYDVDEMLRRRGDGPRWGPEPRPSNPFVLIPS